MDIEITINTDNAAFEDPQELPRILRRLADYYSAAENGPEDCRLMDINGNHVGIATTFKSTPCGPDLIGNVFGGPGTCPYCQNAVSNLGYHTHRCEENPDVSGS